MFPNRVFVAPSQIASSLGRLRLLDVRYSLESPMIYGIGEYQKKHIAGASFVDLDKEITGPLGGASTARHPMPDCGTFLKWCKSRGIGRVGQPVICYDDQSGGMGACRMWWMLDAVGVEAYVLDGGIQAYIAEGLPTETGADPTALSGGDTLVPGADSSAEWSFAGRNSFHAFVEEKNIPLEAKIVDARLAPRFLSTVRPMAMDTVPGHIPNSVNHPWTSNMVESIPGQKKLLPFDDLKRHMEHTLQGSSSADHMVFTCASGVTACVNIAVARHVGLGCPTLYAGAWSEYSGLHRVQLVRCAIETYGFCLTMESKNLMGNAKVTPENAAIIVDGTKFDVFLDAPGLAQEAALHMFLHEKATAHFKSGAKMVIEVIPKSE